MSETRTFTAAASVTVEALIHDIWAVYVDVDGWTSWDDGLEKTRRHGAFTVGTTCTLVPRGADPVEATLVSVVQGEEFTGEVVAPFGTIRTQHRLRPLDDDYVLLTHEVTARIAADAAAGFAAQVWPGLQRGVSESLLSLADVVGA